MINWFGLAAGLTIAAATAQTSAQTTTQCVGWTPAPSTSDPHILSKHNLAYDGRNIVLYGGGILWTQTLYLKTWLWDTHDWVQIETSTFPYYTPFDEPAMAYHEASDRVILFGRSSSQPITWAWSGDTHLWTKLTPETSPPARNVPQMCYDQTRQELVLFGGVSGHTKLQDTWVFDGITWTHRLTTQAPGPRAYPAMAYEPNRRTILLFGGVKENHTEFTNDLWEWNGSDWALVEDASTTEDRPRARANAHMCFSPELNALLLVGGRGEYPLIQPLADTWTWDGEQWAQLAVESFGNRLYFDMIYHPGIKAMVIFGGTESPPGTVKLSCAQPCQPDCNMSGRLDFFDVLCFFNKFNVGASGSDCDDSGNLDFYDILCYLNAFDAGC